MITDLHTHTTASDGTLTPAKLLAAASAKRIELLAITDHDTLAGYRAAVAHGMPAGLRLIAGIELSTRWRKIGVHILGLGVGPGSPTILAAEKHQQSARRERARGIASRLEKLKLPNLHEHAAALAGDAPIGRPHFARALVAHGIVKDTQTAFAKYLGAGKAGDIRNGWADLSTTIGWILESGGIPVLAHPAKYRLTKTRLGVLISEFADAGGQAIEVVSGAQDPATTRQLARLCAQHELMASAGSDFHEPGRRWAELGGMTAVPSTLCNVAHQLEARRVNDD